MKLYAGDSPGIPVTAGPLRLGNSAVGWMSLASIVESSADAGDTRDSAITAKRPASETARTETRPARGLRQARRPTGVAHDPADHARARATLDLPDDSAEERQQLK